MAGPDHSELITCVERSTKLARSLAELVNQPQRENAALRTMLGLPPSIDPVAAGLTRTPTTNKALPFADPDTSGAIRDLPGQQLLFAELDRYCCTCGTRLMNDRSLSTGYCTPCRTSAAKQRKRKR